VDAQLSQEIELASFIAQHFADLLQKLKFTPLVNQTFLALG
jgi:hypothetical protein